MTWFFFHKITTEYTEYCDFNASECGKARKYEYFCKELSINWTGPALKLEASVVETIRSRVWKGRLLKNTQRHALIHSDCDSWETAAALKLQKQLLSDRKREWTAHRGEGETWEVWNLLCEWGSCCWRSRSAVQKNRVSQNMGASKNI